jgi:hypothetical protein
MSCDITDKQTIKAAYLAAFNPTNDSTFWAAFKTSYIAT